MFIRTLLLVLSLALTPAYTHAADAASQPAKDAAAAAAAAAATSTSTVVVKEGTVKKVPETQPKVEDGGTAVEDGGAAVEDGGNAAAAIKEVVESSEGVFAAARSYFLRDKEATTSKALLAFLLIAALLRVLLSLIKMTKPFLEKKLGKRTIRLTCVGVGVLIFFTAQMGIGLSWPDAVVAALGGPGAIIWFELEKIFRK